MVKIIKGKRFDTETAIKIAKWDNSLGSSNFNFVSETLFRTQSGTYFLVTYGGPLTKYAFEIDGIKGFGSSIRPLLKKGASEWLKINRHRIRKNRCGDFGRQVVPGSRKPARIANYRLTLDQRVAMFAP